MSHIVDVIEIKRTSRAMSHPMQDLRFLSQNDILLTTDNRALSGDISNSNTVSHESRRAVHIRGRNGEDKYIIWSPEFEGFVERELAMLVDAQTLVDDQAATIRKQKLEIHHTKSTLDNYKLSLSSEKDAHAKSKVKIKQWIDISDRFKRRLFNTRTTYRIGFILNVVGACTWIVASCIN